MKHNTPVFINLLAIARYEQMPDYPIQFMTVGNLSYTNKDEAQLDYAESQQDEETGEIEALLLPATNISIMTAHKLVRDFGGVCYPAHVDRDSLSILSVLGEIDESCGFTTAELADKSKLGELRALHPILDTLNIVTNSDAHYLENMRDAENYLDLPELTRENVIKYLDSVKQ